MRYLPLLALSALAATAGAATESDFAELFNGHDLNGWTNVNCAPETWSVQEGMIHCTGKPIGALRTVRQYENFILELDWRHLSSGGNSGIFIWASPIAAPGVPFLRAIEVQVLDAGFNVPGKTEWYTTHGDVFPIHGSTMKPFGRHNGMRSFPSEDRSHSSPEWNHYRIACTNGVIRLHVNGKEVSGGEECNYRKGYIGLESEGAPIDFRNIRIHELPSSNAPADLSAPLDENWRTLFTGLDLRGWKAATASRWNVKGEKINLSGSPGNTGEPLWTEQQFGNAEFVIDCRVGKISGEAKSPAVQIRGIDAQVKLDGAASDRFQRFRIRVAGGEIVVRRGETEIQRVSLPPGSQPRGAFGLVDTGSPVEFMNIYYREL